jgi:RimJ/RimL family protein N-acetyltransferase
MTHVIHPETGLPIGAEVDTRPAARPVRTNLSGRFVTLVPLDLAQADDLYELSHGTDKHRLWLYLAEGPFPDRESFRGYIEKRAASDDPLFFAIIDNETNRPVGHAAYMRIKPVHRVIEVGNILYTPEISRKPGGTEAMYLMAQHAFEQLNHNRYEWKCNALNAPSRRAALRFGFTFEGIFPQHMIQKGRIRNTAWFSMLASEWPSRKAALEKWLSPANFDEQRRQKNALANFSKDIPQVNSARYEL